MVGMDITYDRVSQADSTKIGVESSFRFATPSDVDVLITDSGISDADASALAAADVEVVIV